MCSRVSPRMGDEIPGSVQLAVDGAMDQLGELLVSTTDTGASVPLRLVPVGGGQFLLAKLTEDPPDAVGLVGDASPGDEELKRQLAAVQGEVVARLERLSRKLSKVADRCQGLGDRLLQLTARLTHAAPAGPSRMPRSSVTVSSPAGGTVEDYPNGSWLGDPMDPEARIRVPIASADLDMVNRTCTTPEKMALTLLDFLFDRQVQATSNISGTGRHGKHQLDPLRIFGIRCHLVYQFGIGEHDWHRIKQNMDSKCRTAFRRKHRGMSLVVKAFRDRAPQGAGHRGQVLAELGSASSVPITLLSEDMAARIASMEPQIIRTEHGDIQVVQATAEQLAQMEGDPRIHILASAQVLSTDEQEADDDLQP
ncbi:protein BANP isoform X1 [Ixodes scapularis]|uniref:protein BANP isoform X1 n=2 Tax=Ixodes scapularis TaxID=6945 RepID=UPI001C385BE2|nr:protein BANP isoform X1 [Ixodes scapularis]